MSYVKKALPLLVACLLLALSFCPAHGAELLNLKMNLAKGQIFDFTMSADSVIAQTMNGVDLQIKQRVGVSMWFEVSDVAADGTVTAKMAFAGIRIHQEGPTGNLDFDTANPPGDAAGPVEDVAAGEAESPDLAATYFTVKMSAQGEVLEIQGLDIAIEALLQQLGLDPEKLALMKKSFNQQFNDKTIQELMQQGSANFPDHPIAVGDSWTTRMTLSNIYPFTVESTYTFREYRDGAAYLDIAATMTPVEEPAPLEFAGVQMKYSFSGNQVGTMRIQNENSYAYSGTVTQQLAGYIELSGPEMKEALKWPMNIKTVVEFEMKERDMVLP